MLIIWSSLYVDQISWECKSYNVDIYWKEQPRCNSDKEMKIWWKLIISHLWDIFAEISGHIYTKNLVVCLLGFFVHLGGIDDFYIFHVKCWVWLIHQCSVSSSLFPVKYFFFLQSIPIHPTDNDTFLNIIGVLARHTENINKNGEVEGGVGEVGAANWQQGKNSPSSSCDNHKF